MTKHYLFLIATMLICINSFSQVGIGTSTPDISALLELKATDRGLLPPRMNTAQRDLIPVPKEGLMIYQTDGNKGLYVYNGASWQPVNLSSGAWSLTGNAGTNTATNFIGTTDNKSLLFKVNNVNAGFLSSAGNTYWGVNSGNINSTGYNNVAIGNNTMPLCTTCIYNVAVGDSALRMQSNNPAGYYFNTALGSKTLEYNTTGSYNSASGAWALEGNTIGMANTAQGAFAMVYNNTGNYNTAQGAYALFSNQTGNNNVALGYGTLYSSQTANANIAIGALALKNNKDGHRLMAIGDSAFYTQSYSQNINDGSMAIGSKALFSNTTGYSNTAIGYEAMKQNTSGIYNTAVGKSALTSNSTGTSNTAVGKEAMNKNTTGYMNVAVGGVSLYENTTGIHNTALGYQALQNNTMGNRNVSVGSATMYGNTSGYGNTALGFNTMVSNITGHNNVAIGIQALYKNINGNNSVAIGDSALFYSQQGYNTATGSMALYKNVDGFYNQANGYAALFNNTSGTTNTANGTGALQSNTTGSLNTSLGYNADVMSGNLHNATAIGAEATVACSNCLILGAINSSNVFTSTTKVDVGIGTNSPQTDLHVNPDGAGSILVGTNRSAGGFTALEMGISAQSNGYSYIQATKASGASYGSLALNPSGGTVGVRINTALSPLHIKQSSDAYPVNGGGLRLERQANTNHWELGTDAGDDLDFTFNGVAKAYINDGTGVYTTVSDRRLKKDISSLSTVLPAIMLLQAKTYHYTDNNATASLSYGFIAQDVEKLFPDFVTTKGEDSVKAIAYQNFSVIAIKAIQEQEATIEALTKRLKDVEAILEQLLKANNHGASGTQL